MPGTAGIRRQNYIVERLTSPALEQQWNDWLNNWRDADSEQVTISRLYVTYMRDQMLDAVSGLEDERELESAAALMYMQLRAQAALMNTQMESRMERGMPSPEIACRAALLSILLAQVEEVLGSTRQERLDAILNHPLDAASAAVLPVVPPQVSAAPQNNGSGSEGNSIFAVAATAAAAPAAAPAPEAAPAPAAIANIESVSAAAPRGDTASVGAFAALKDSYAPLPAEIVKKTPATVAAAARASRELERSLVSAHTLRLRLTAFLTEEETPLEPLSDDALIASVEGLIATLHMQDMLVQGYEAERTILEREIGHASGREVASVMSDMRLHLDMLLTENRVLRERIAAAAAAGANSAGLVPAS